MIEGQLFNDGVLISLKTEFPEAVQLNRSPLTDNGADNLLDFFVKFATSYHQQVTEVRTGFRDPDDFEIPILLDIAFPNSGKSRYADILRRMFAWLPNTDLSLDLPHRQRPLKILDWEKHGEERARINGEILTLPDKAFEEAELVSANKHFALSIQECLHDRTTQAILIEAPGNTAINIEGQLYGRDLGTGVLIDLAQNKGLFEEGNQPKYVVWGAGLRAGPMVRFLLSYARDRFRKAAIENDLTKAIVTAGHFNIPLPETMDEVRRLGQGASIEQMDLIEKLADDMIRAAIAKGINLRIADFYDYRKLVDPRIYDFVPGLIVNSTTQRAMVSLVENFLLDRNHLALPEARTLIADNNPSAEDLGLTEDHFSRIYTSFNL